MALPSSGALSFSAIATEFGGSAPHSMSEYYPLVGLGVSGLPSSGTFNFSQFHGKSNQVTISVWVTSGYNQSNSSSAWVNQGNVGPIHVHNWSTGRNLNGGGMRVYSATRTSSTVWNNGNERWIRSNEHSTDYDRWIRTYWLRKELYVTTTTNTWIDTSAYQNQTTTVGI
jgi:hypothetical protein